MKKYGILFVCTGNICRSPAAEGVFRHYAGQNGLAERLSIDSAGTHGYHIGEPPDRRAIAAALSRGVKIGGLRARRVKQEDFNEFDLMIAMDTSHYDILSRMAPKQGRSKLGMFMDFAPEAGLSDVADPYYGGPEDFERMMDVIESGVNGILRHLQQELY